MRTTARDPTCGPVGVEEKNNMSCVKYLFVIFGIEEVGELLEVQHYHLREVLFLL